MVTEKRGPVIVVGAGPVGMTAAAALANAGIETVIVERSPEPQPDWRASTFHAATLELLEEIDITPPMLAEGLRVPRYQFRDRRTGLIAEFDLTLLADETRFPYRLQLNQQRLVSLLWERLRTDPRVTLRFGTEAHDVRQTRDGVELTVRTPSGVETITGDHLIGADGAGSTVRKSLGLTFEGITYEERFLIVSTPWDMQVKLPGIAEVNYISDPEEWLFILRTPDAWRVLWPVPPDVDDATALSDTEIQRHLQAVAHSDEEYPVIDTQIYRIHQRVAETFRTGRVALIGDAAHLNSPVGGVGLNSGIHDAFDLTRRLIRIRHDGADLDAELDAFAAVRRQIAVGHVQADTQRNTDRLREKDPELRRQSELELKQTAADPDRARQWLRRVSLLDSVRRFGVGLAPAETHSRLAAVLADGHA
ncbi:NAD(P)/FAD-dependent oxidoreductase [Nonomuraea sp. B12E4]|uniref:FAD-dependent oxidoreductase n=1 Tax=Nonomuraea sp. B12E4 TaxID=3153564 RepID=UPI00325CEB2E